MADAPQRYPLAWPAHRPRTKPSARRRGEFVANGKKKPIPGDAAERLEDQITRLGGSYAVLSSNMELRMDGRPRADRSEPADPGVCVYFLLKGAPVSMPCDTFTTVAQNILAIANHIDAARRIESYGVGTAAETLQAFTALPPPAGSQPTPRARSWREVLGFSAHFPEGLTPKEAKGVVEGRYRERAAKAHPDTGGSTEAMAELNAARTAALLEVNP